jgi:trans-aconitate methyltransferase
MSFEVAAQAYGRFMGRYSEPLARELADLVGVAAPQRALDVGCGTGALTTVLVDRLGAGAVQACDPSDSFVAAMHDRFPAVDVRNATAEALPYGDGSFDRTLAALVVHFMTDPPAGLAEMARVTADGGMVAATVWDDAGGSPLSLFWQAVRDLDPGAKDESGFAGVHEGELRSLFEAAGMTGAVQHRLSVDVEHPTFEYWWEPYTLGVGPAGDYVARLSDAARVALQARCRELLPAPPFTLHASAWTVTWRKP